MGVMDREAPAVEPVGEAVPFTSRLHAWVVTVDHKRLGIMYVVAGLGFFVVAGTMAALMRLQLAVPNNGLVPPQVFNRLMTMHGTTMIFFVAVPILFGFGNYLVPLMLGARDLAFPAPERVRVLALPLRRPAALLQLRRGRRAVRRRLGARRRVVRLRAADRAGRSRAAAAPTTGSSASS